MPVAFGLVIGSLDRSLVEALRANDVETEVVADGASLANDVSEPPDIVCLSFSAATGAAAPIDTVRARFPNATVLLIVPASEAGTGAVVARELEAELVTSPVDARRAGEAIARLLARRARHRELEALLQRIRSLDPAAAAGVEALGHDREAKTRALDEALAFRSSILANLAHEVRTPLTVLRGFVELLDEDFAGVLDADQRELLQGIRASGGQLVAVFQALVDLARADTGRIEPRPASVYLPELLSDVAREIKPALAGRPVRFVLDVERRLGWIRTEPEWLRQIVSCLLSNAAKFTREGEIRLAAGAIDEPAEDERDEISALVRSPTPARRAIEIEIADTGRGIAPDQQARIFEAFQQEDVSTTRSHEGLGIGLTVVRELAREIGATLHLDSRPGAGTRIHLRIPLEPVRERVAASEASGRRQHSSGEASSEPVTEIARLHRRTPASMDEAIPLALHALDRIVDAPLSLFAAKVGVVWRIVDAAGQAAAAASRPPADLLDRAAREGRASTESGMDDRWFAVSVRDGTGTAVGVLLCRAAAVRKLEAWAALRAIGGWLGLVYIAHELATERVELAAVLSRSIKDPLGALLAYTQVLLRGLRGPLTAEQRTIVLSLEKGIHRAILSGLDLLDLEHARAGRTEVARRPFSLTGVIEHVLARHASALELAQIRVDRDVLLEGADCLGDEIRTDRAVSALLRAFVDGAPTGAVLAISAHAEAEHIRLEIRGAVTEPRPFERVFGSSPTRLALDDTLGLALARVAIEAQGGSVALEIAEPGIVVALLLPRARDDRG